MISVKAREKAKKIDLNRKEKARLEDIKEQEKYEEAKFMDEYRICPRCSGRVKWLLLPSLFSIISQFSPINVNHFGCIKCGLIRNI